MTRSESDYENQTTDGTLSHNPCAHGGPGDLGTQPTLGIDDFESPGEPQPYAFLIQRPLHPSSDPNDAPFGFIPIHLRAFDFQGIPVPQAIVQSEDWDPSWTWEVRETDNEIRLACMGRWSAQAACANGLAKVIGGMRRSWFVGREKLDFHFMMAMSSYNPVRVRNLGVVAW